MLKSICYDIEMNRVSVTNKMHKLCEQSLRAKASGKGFIS